MYIRRDMHKGAQKWGTSVEGQIGIVPIRTLSFNPQVKCVPTKPDTDLLRQWDIWDYVDRSKENMTVVEVEE
jgi:hypothetical protein